MDNFSGRLNLIIATLKVRKGDFATAGGVNAATLGGYLNDGRLPNQKTLANWVKKFNINAHWLLTGEGDMLQTSLASPLTSPLAQRVNQVASTMSDSGADDLSILRATRAMIDGEINKVLKERGGYGVAEPQAGLGRAAEEPAGYADPKKAAGGSSG